MYRLNVFFIFFYIIFSDISDCISIPFPFMKYNI